MKAQTLLEIENVYKNYRDVKAINGISFKLAEGEVLGLFGHNGAGKTTTIKLILNIIDADGGSIRIFGKKLNAGNIEKLKQSIGYLPENVQLYEQLTGREVLYYLAKLKRCDKKQCDILLDQLNLAHARDRKVKTYSKGMRQRLGLVQALLGKPRLLLLDEPTVGLDPIATHEFYEIISELQQQGCGIILCSHVLDDVEKYLDRAVILARGNVLANGGLADLRKQANLSTRIRVYGDNQNLKIHSQYLRSMKKINGHCHELFIKDDEKLVCMKSLLSQGGVKDVELQIPSLSQIYRYFNQLDMNATAQSAYQQELP